MLTRRELVVAGGTLAVTSALTTPAHARLLSLPGARAVGRGTFRDGVASGEPSPTAITFWGRLRTDRPRSAARLVVARDEGLTRTVATVLVPTSAGVDHTLKVRVDGLKPAHTYWYAWESADDVSPTGRTRTAPPDDSRAPVAIGASSCQNFSAGFFNGHRDAAALGDLDLYAFLGDYTYEYRFGDYGTLRGAGADIASTDLASYRAKLELYRGDANLRELHRLFPIVDIWDDHEIADNYTDGDPVVSVQQRSAGYRASYEWLPRLAIPGDRFRIYKTLRYGRNVELLMLDERQYRDPGVPGKVFLGRPQMNWFKQALERSEATWKLIANGTLFAPLSATPGGVTGELPVITVDGWGGYPRERDEVTAHLAAKGIGGVCFLTGDAHLYVAANIERDGRSIATEYMCGSLTSSADPSTQDLLLAAGGGAASALRALNPHVKFLDIARHGWGVVRAGDDGLQIEFRSSNVLVDGAPSTSLATFHQAPGSNEVHQVGGAPSGGETRVGEDGIDAPATAGSALAARRAHVARAAHRDALRRAHTPPRRRAR